LIDLLKTDVLADFATRPALLRERYSEGDGLIVIDEVQKLPQLLDEVHWMIENTHRHFLLTGSSARKLRRGAANLLGGRALRYQMAPLSYIETTGIDLERVMVSGLLPSHYLADDPIPLLRSYIGDYLAEEIAAESAARSLPQFAQFLRVAAITSGCLLNYTNVAQEAGVKARAVRDYFQILEDTMLGYRLEPWRKTKDRRLITTEKFYLFDVGVTNFISRRKPAPGTPEFGQSFEQFILMELMAYRAYADPELEITFWRSASGFEVDFILNDMQVVIEAKSSRRVHDGDLRSLRALMEEHRPASVLVVCDESEPRKMPGIEVLPWRRFLDRLWSGELLAG